MSRARHSNRFVKSGTGLTSRRSAAMWCSAARLSMAFLEGLTSLCEIDRRSSNHTVARIVSLS